MSRITSLIHVAAQRKELDKCVCCGLCQSTCPTYLTTGWEGLTARGKIALLQGLLDKSIEPSASVADIFDNCLTCYACQTVCPAGVKTELLWTAARQDLAPKSTRRRIKRLAMRMTIGNRRVFNLALSVGARFYGFDRSASFSGEVKKSFPVFKGAPYVQKLKKEYLPENKAVGKVALLLGCSGNFISPNVVDASIALLVGSGWRVVIPEEQGCCGAPAINNADWKTARKLARRTIDTFNRENFDWVTSPDATCVHAISGEFMGLLAGDEQYVQAAKHLARKTLGLGNLLAKAVDEKRLIFNPLKTTVTFHDSCHSTHVGKGGGWRKVLGAVRQLEIKAMKNSDHCCGFGGSYSIYYPETSDRIAYRKLSSAIETGAQTMLVGSPGCQMRLQLAIESGNSRKFQVRHVAELLADIIA